MCDCKFVLLQLNICLTLSCKKSWWSRVLDSFFLLAKVNGMSRNEALEYILFFSHQCNTTPLFCSASDRLARSFKLIRKMRKNNKTLYSILVETCNEIVGDQDTNKTSDIGCRGKHPRFSAAAAYYYEEKVVKENISKLNNLFQSSMKQFNNMKLKQRSKEGVCQYIQCTQQLITDISKAFFGFGTLKAMHLVQLSSLIGLIPLEYYIYIPLHFGGGTGRFLSEGFGLTKSNCTLEELNQFNAEMLFNLRGIFNNELTSSMLEQCMCMSARSNLKKDHWLTIPSYENGKLIEDGSKFTKGEFEGETLQKYYRVNGSKAFKWKLESFNGITRSLILPQSDESFCKWEGNILKFNKTM